MANKITEDQRERMRYRRIVLKDKLGKIKHLITGRMESYMPFICNENGHVTKEKTDWFVGEMLGALQRYIELEPERQLTDDSMKMYESFLYCALMSLDSERLQRDPGVMTWKLPSVFEDIVRRAEDVEIKGCDSYNQYLTEYYDHYRSMSDSDSIRKKFGNAIKVVLTHAEKDSDFFIQVQKSLEKLGYQQFIECLTPKTLNRLRRNYNIRYNISENEEEESAYGTDPVDSTEKMDMPEVPVLKLANNVCEESPEEDYDSDETDWELEAEYKNSLPQEDPDAMIDYYAEREEEERKREYIGNELDSLGENQTYADNKNLSDYAKKDVKSVEIDKAEENLENTIAPQWQGQYIFDKKTLCENYFRFVYLYFDNPDRKYFAEDIENMVDTFLCEHDMSAFSLSGENYAMINYCVDRTKDRLEREIARVKRK